MSAGEPGLERFPERHVSGLGPGRHTAEGCDGAVAKETPALDVLGVLGVLDVLGVSDGEVAEESRGFRRTVLYRRTGSASSIDTTDASESEL